MSLLVPQLPETAPFSPEQRAWLNGFFAGIFSRAPAVTANPQAGAHAPALTPLTILFGSQTGTSESLAKKLAKEAGKRGFVPTLVDMAQCTPSDLARHQNVLVITSTYGDGEPPDNARALHAALAASDAPSLKGVRYSVCALGDRNYPAFCRCGAEFDERLARLGAERVCDRVECDVDYDALFTAWIEAVLPAFSPASAPVAATPEINPLPSPAGDEPREYSKSHPFPAPILTLKRLNGAGSAKEVNHVEFSLANSGLVYEAGDALGVYPQNCPDLVAEVLTLLSCDGEEAVSTPIGELPLRTALLVHYDLGKPTPELIGHLGLDPSSSPLHVVDALVLAGGKRVPAPTFVSALRKLQPRLYSISSSPRAHAGTVHLTVGAVRYEAHGRARKGVCSTFLAERALAHGTAGVFVHHNRAFRLPTHPDTPVIMIGPGTGIAPFRAFLHERQAIGAKGRNWLFFGDQHQESDFLYREEWEHMTRAGVLTRLSTAFSRDQATKVYVQHRLREAAVELYSWLQDGAHIYVCGDASRMAKDVHAALVEVVASAGAKSPDDAAAYVQALQAAKRYSRDVY